LCGLHQAYYHRVDHYLSLFFIPVWRVKKGTPVLMCDRCKQNVEGIRADSSGPASSLRQTCGHCGREIDPEFRFCPHCGKKR
jgi:predicted amidophosphoribosyltransferase